LKLAAYFDGISLDHVGAYRTLGQQTTLFKQRYSLTPQGRNITRKVNGQTYYLRDGFAPSSSPGASVHGLGLAIDVANASGQRLEWLLAGNAEKFGWSWQVANGPQAEAWHLQYWCADKAPKGVVEALKAFPELNA
jgi:LAS superfamily LD-carboxypeptidase LdcB